MMSANSSPVSPSPFRSYIPPHEKVYGAICISPDNKILVVRGRSSGKWSFPKGHLKSKSNERAFDCALRELYEETGIYIDAKSLNPCALPSKRLRVGEYFILDLDQEIMPLPRDQREISEARWVNEEQLKEFLVDDRANIDIRSFVTKMLAERV